MRLPEHQQRLECMKCAGFREMMSLENSWEGERGVVLMEDLKLGSRLDGGLVVSVRRTVEMS